MGRRHQSSSDVYMNKAFFNLAMIGSVVVLLESVGLTQPCELSPSPIAFVLTANSVRIESSHRAPWWCCERTGWCGNYIHLVTRSTVSSLEVSFPPALIGSTLSLCSLPSFPM